ncbi:toll/interleukin-1 receptor domain-containing protein [Nitrosopumilus sp.]|uniref:toll/interleukin-1 receptor domain-containing protein n=1 Tax=Nitrosopumilus sp. TaxID=2024843 RepID=UPI00247B56C5|nr:toll/interleukin-1 receptor domain-containing protein [Nitrosopumilus sp.]MCV0431477.1 toll/interleukin-1 receptor domain-containing protein [Nitrosopumilus sp.]
MKVFISHTFANEDRTLSERLEKILAKMDIEGYLAEKSPEYDLLIRDKIRKEIEDSDHMVAIITNNAKESASVNQELGYALREGINPIIMIEKDATVGVLTHGIEPEIFQRDNFDEHCNKVRNFLLQKGSRVKVTPEERRWVLDNIYRPLYNEIKVLDNEKVFLTQKLEDPITSVDSFSQFKLDSELRELFGNLSLEIKQWNSMSVAKEREFSYKQHEIGNIFKKCFGKAGLLRDDSDIILSSHSWQEPHHWVEAHKEVLLFEPDITNGDDLYKKLYAKAMLRDDEHVQWLKGFKKHAGLYDCLFDVLSDARKVLELEISDKELLDQKNKIKKIVSKIKLELEIKFNLVKF